MADDFYKYMRMMIGTCEYAVYAESEEPMPTMALV